MLIPDSGIIFGMFREPFVVPGIEPGSARWKANALPDMLSLWPPNFQVKDFSFYKTIFLGARKIA